MTWQQLGSLAARLAPVPGHEPAHAPAPATGEGVFYAGGQRADGRGRRGRHPRRRRHVARAGSRASRRRGERGPFLPPSLQALQARRAAAQAAFDARAPEKTLPALAAGLPAVRALRERCAARLGGRRAARAARPAAPTKERDFEARWRCAQGVDLEVAPTTTTWCPARPFTVTATASPTRAPSRSRSRTSTLRAPAGWTRRRAPRASPRRSARGQRVERDVRGDGRRRARATRSPTGGAPARPTASSSTCPRTRRCPGARRTSSRSVRYRGRAARRASLEQPALLALRRALGRAARSRRSLNVVPALSVRLTPGDRGRAAAARPRPPRVPRRPCVNNGKGRGRGDGAARGARGLDGRARRGDAGFRYEGEEIGRALLRHAARRADARGSYEVRAVAARDGREFREGYQVDRLRRTSRSGSCSAPRSRACRPSTCASRPGSRVGYVMGAGDEVADRDRAARRHAAHLLDPGRPRLRRLSRFTTIVTGIRAYQTRTDLQGQPPAADAATSRRAATWSCSTTSSSSTELAEPPRAGGFDLQRPARTRTARSRPIRPRSRPTASPTRERRSASSRPTRLLQRRTRSDLPTGRAGCRSAASTSSRRGTRGTSELLASRTRSPRTPAEEGAAGRRARRQGDVDLRRPRAVPAASGGHARRVPAAGEHRQPPAGTGERALRHVPVRRLQRRRRSGDTAALDRALAARRRASWLSLGAEAGSSRRSGEGSRPVHARVLRTAILETLEDATRRGRRVLFGIDHQWSWPLDLWRAAGLDHLPWRRALSALVEGSLERPALGPPRSVSRGVQRVRGSVDLPLPRELSRASLRHSDDERVERRSGPADRARDAWSEAGHAARRHRRRGGTDARRPRRAARAAPGGGRRTARPRLAVRCAADDGVSHVGVEVYPSFCRAKHIPKSDDADARACASGPPPRTSSARWTCARAPPRVRRAARLEGWILGASVG